MRTRVTVSICGLLSFGLTAVAWKVGFLQKTPWLGGLATKEGAPGVIALGVVALLGWVLLALAARLLRLRREEAVVDVARDFSGSDHLINRAQQSTRRGLELTAMLKAYIELTDGPKARLAAGALARSELKERLDLMGRRILDQEGTERTAFLLTGSSSLAANSSQRYFAPLKALVWAMPGFGFMATTLEMAKAVTGMGDAVGGTVDYQGLRSLLVSHVIPHLAGAFDVTVLGLSASIVGYLAVSATSTLDDSVSSASDQVCLQLLARIPPASGSAVPGRFGPSPSTPSAESIEAAVREGVGQLTVEVGGLTMEVGDWTTAIRQLKAVLARLLGGRAG